MGKIKFNKPMLYGIRSDLAVKSAFLEKTWERFANHYKDSEIEFLESIDGKNSVKLSIEEIDKLRELKQQMEVAKLLPKYHNHNCTVEEYDIVSDFYDEYSLATFMRSRLTREEIDNSNNIVDSLKDNELEGFIKVNEENYDNLSVQETYTLYLANSRLKDIKDKELNDRIRREQFERDQALIRHLNRDYGPRLY